MPHRNMNPSKAPPPLLPALLEARKFGKPPFLVRNLRYVRDDKLRAKRRVWDLSWTQANYRSASGARHLVLTISPTRCILERNVTRQILHPDKQLPAYRGGNSYTPRLVTVRICLCVKQSDGHYVSFAVRDVSVRVWPREHLDAGVEPVDVKVAERFDLSAVLPVLGTKPSVLSLVVEVWAGEHAEKPPNAFPVKVRGEVVLWDREKSSNGTAVPSGFVTVPLQAAAEEGGILPGDAVDSEITPVEAINLLDEVREVQSGDDSDLEMVSGGPSTSRRPRVAGSLVLRIVGSVEEAMAELAQIERPRVFITLSYSSHEVPFWDGILRHDFICPWCHRNCYRLRTLLSHFQVEHDHMKFSLEGLPNVHGEDDSTPGSIPFLLKFEVMKISEGPEEGGTQKRKKTGDKSWTKTSGAKDLPEISYINPHRYGSFYRSIRNSKRDDEMRDAMQRVTMNDDDRDSEAASTECDDVKETDFLSMVREELGSTCRHCLRIHDLSYGNRTFCGEYCEMIYRKNLMEGSGDRSRSNGNLEPLSNNITVPRKKGINFSECMGHLELYHVVSMAEVKKEHFNEEDPDSEEEVDQTWRLQLLLERVRHLEGVSAKEKVLWMMWNKFAHNNYPLPSVYADRYMRYTLELFAIEHGPQIAHLKLRLQFVGFLRAIHIHGLIDSVAIKSIMLCLDGKKKRRDINISCRPELPNEGTPTASGFAQGRRNGREPLRHRVG